VEITAPGPLVRPDGTALCSWSRRPYLDLNFEDARFLAVPSWQRFRMKKWDMYHLITPRHYLSFLVAWIGYGAFCSAYVYDRETKQGLDDMRLRPADPAFPMMRNSTAGVTEYPGKRAAMRFEVAGEERYLRVDWPGFAGQGLWAEITLHLPADHDSICATHLTHPRRMHYDHKINCMTAQGEIKLQNDIYRLEPQTAFGMLDFGRGFFPTKQFWFWAVSSGRLPDGSLLGWNLGHGNSPLQTNENAIFYRGRLTKTGVVKCEVPQSDIMDPWRVWSDDPSLDLTFIPQSVRDVNLNLGALYSRGQPALGTFSGHLTTNEGEIITIRDMFGLYEWMDQKW
jgi:hypothetical protein